MTATPLVSVEDLQVHFRSRTGLLSGTGPTVRAVDGVTFDIRPGESFGLVGESGCGKSTLGRAALGLAAPSAGRVRFDGRDLAALPAAELRRLRRRMQMIFQDPYASLDPKMNVAEILAEPIITHKVAAGRAADDLVDELMRLVGLDPRRKHRYPHEFSGGQRQRIGIARALAIEPDFLVCDEATSALDVSIRAQVLNLLSALRRSRGLSFLFISHDLGTVRHMSDRIGVMYLGQLVEVGPVEAVYATPIHPYTHALLSAVPIPDPEIERRRRRIILEGDLPNPAAPPSGCRFHTRCWLYRRLDRPVRCREEAPALAGSPNHRAACHFPTEAGRASTEPTAPSAGRRRTVKVTAP